MNVAHLETIIRSALRGENMSEKSASLAELGAISPAEHRSLQSMTSQLEANSGLGPHTHAAGDGVGPNLTWL